MDNYTLYPPNSQSFSDDVIGSVVQRAWLFNECTQGEDGDYFTYHKDSHPSSYSLNKKAYNIHDRRIVSIATIQVPIVEKKRTRDELEPDSVVIKSTVKGEERQRELSRMRQVRYRKKKYALAKKLEATTVQLQMEIEELEVRRRAVSSAVPTDKSVWEVALKYFQVFRFGARQSSGKSSSDSVTMASSQLYFLLENMSEEVLFNSKRGAEEIMQMWKYQSLWLKDVELHLVGLNQNSANTLIATMTTSFTISERTLEKVLPHLSSKGGEPVSRELHIANALLGRRVTAHGSAHFGWDPVLGRVSRMTTQSDLLTPFLRFLGSLDGVAVVFEKAIITPDFQWRRHY